MLVDFVGNRVRASRTTIPWPDQTDVSRRASVNSFGYGGSNAHAIIEQAPPGQRVCHVFSYLAEDDFSFDDDCDVNSDNVKPFTLVLSANDAATLRANIDALCRHLINPRVRVNLADLAYTLSERRSHLYHRASFTSNSVEFETSDFVLNKKSPKAPRIGFVFTGQGAQWPQMGKDLLQCFPQTRTILEGLDAVLKGLPNPPTWSIITELTELRTAEHLRQPEFSQPLVTALQLAILDILESWGIKPNNVVGHSSGEIAAAYAAGLLDRTDAIKTAFYRGRAAVNCKDEADVGMLAVGLGADTIAPFLDKYDGQVWIACFNSPNSLTISGQKKSLVALADDVKTVGYFARLLQVDLAYHSELMGAIGEEYERLLTDSVIFGSKFVTSEVTMFSSVTASRMTKAADAHYWKINMVSPVRFSEALAAMVTDLQKTDILIEIGPSSALAGPISQVLKSLPAAADITYFASWSRGKEAAKSLFDVAGRLFCVGAPVNLHRVNNYDENVRVIADLPNYTWNHSIKYWFENTASLEWRFKPYVTHDLLGSKVLGSPWQTPTWRKRLNLADVPWLRDHVMGPDVLMPAAGYIVMALEAMYQKHCSLKPEEAVKSPNALAYRFRNIKFERALVVEDGKSSMIILSLVPASGSTDWNEFRVSTEVDGAVLQHCQGLIRVQQPVEEDLTRAALAPLENPTSAKLWYKAQDEIGMRFGPAFRKILNIEATTGKPVCRTRLSLAPPQTKWEPQSYYPIHPAVLDACFQSVSPALLAGERSRIMDIMVPVIIDDLLINKVPKVLQEGLSRAESVFTERGRKDQPKSYSINVSTYDPDSGALFVRTRGLRITKLDLGSTPDPHTFHRVSWKPDVSLLTQDQLTHLPLEDERGASKLHTVIDLVAHKKPTLKVLELSLIKEDVSNLWFQASDSSARAAYSRYDFASIDPKTLVSVQTRYESRRKAGFLLARPDKEALGLSADMAYDFAIIRTRKKTEVTVEDIMRNLQSLLSLEAAVLIVVLGDAAPTIEESLNIESLPNDEISMISSGTDTPSSFTNETPSSGNSVDTATSSLSLVSHDLKPALDINVVNYLWSRQTLRRLGRAGGLLHAVLEVEPPTEGGVLAFLGRHIGKQQTEAKPSVDDGSGTLVVLRLDNTTPKLAPSLQRTLGASGWTVIQRSIQLSPSDYTAETMILVLDELSKPVLTRISERQWDTLKALISSGTRLLWVTKGSQLDRVTDPDRALVHGLFRVARREDPTARLTVVDVQSGTSPATSWVIDQVLGLLRRNCDVVENEYAERDGILYIQRIVPDSTVNAFKRAEVEGNKTVVKGLHETDVQVHIHAERTGTLDLVWCEEELAEPQLEPGVVEVEVKAVGVNFKVSLGLMFTRVSTSKNAHGELTIHVTHAGCSNDDGHRLGE